MSIFSHLLLVETVMLVENAIIIIFFGVINHLLWRSHSTPSDANLNSIVAKNSKMYKRTKKTFFEE